jgi:hypothetical protein
MWKTSVSLGPFKQIRFGQGKLFLDQIHDLHQKEISMNNATEPFGSSAHVIHHDLISSLVEK